MSDVSQSYIQELFEYRDGNLYWAVKFTDKIQVGNIVGHINKGRRYTKLNGKDYQISRLIFMYHYGYFPKFVDHIDGNPLNNKIENLRSCTLAENARNSKAPRTNTSGEKNVRWEEKRKKWKVEIRVDNKYKCIGRFDDLELASLVAQESRNKYHKEFARHE